MWRARVGSSVRQLLGARAHKSGSTASRRAGRAELTRRTHRPIRYGAFVILPNKIYIDKQNGH